MSGLARATSTSRSSTGTTTATGAASPRTSISYARPKGASPFRASLVPGVRPVHGARPRARPAALGDGISTVLQPARRALEHADGRDARRERRGRRTRSRHCGSTVIPGIRATTGRRGGRRGLAISVTDVRCRGTSAALPVGPGLRLHRQAAGDGAAAHHGQVQRARTRTRTARSSTRCSRCRSAASTTAGTGDRRDLRAEHDARCAAPGRRGRGRPRDLAARPGDGPGRGAERDRLRRRLPDELRRRRRDRLPAPGSLCPMRPACRTLRTLGGRSPRYSFHDGTPSYLVSDFLLPG